MFDALDNWYEHPGMIESRERVKRGYEAIKKRSNLIFTNAESIKEFLKNDNCEVIYIPNGVDASHLLYEIYHNGLFLASSKMIQSC